LKSKKNFDPLAYIENAFLDKDKPAKAAPKTPEEVIETMPSITSYMSAAGTAVQPASAKIEKELEQIEAKHNGRFRKTVMSATRPRRAKEVASETKIDPALQNVWEALPKNVEFLCSFYDDSVTANYYRGEFKESRQDLIKRLMDPELTLEETSRLLGVCPATVRRYTNRHWLTHHRTAGGQRRFRLSDIVKFVEAHGRFPEA
jgi:excisionase family DNA binding protein